MHPRHILVIDDDPLVRAFLASALEAEGYAVAWAVDGREALSAISEAPPELIVLDLLMPNLDGRQFLESLQRSGPHADVPVIVISAAGELRDVAALPGVKAALAKPFDVKVLLGAVERLSRDRGQEEELAAR